MTKQEAKEFAEILIAYSEGKKIEILNEYFDTWSPFEGGQFEKYPERQYRIAKEPIYRPFKDSVECWVEMTKHEPFGWIQSKVDNTIKSQIVGCDSTGVIICTDQLLNSNFPYLYILDDWEFVDGTPFGFKE